MARVPAIEEELRERAGAVLDDEWARAVAARLRANGFEAGVTRERFAGEDDDEDQPWVVSTDAPDLMVELLVEEYDGWLDDTGPDPGPALPPLDLPAAPRRIKGHFPPE